MSATIKDIARETGLALATISKYINGGTVRPQNKKQIDEAIRKLNYVPRNTARGLRSSKTYRIGLVSGPPNTPHNAFLLSKIENTMRAHGYSLTFMSGDKYKDHVNKFVPHMLRSGIDGLIITSFSLNQDICSGTRQNPCCGAGRTQPFPPYRLCTDQLYLRSLRDRGASDKNGASEDRPCHRFSCILYCM